VLVTTVKNYEQKKTLRLILVIMPALNAKITDFSDAMAVW